MRKERVDFRARARRVRVLVALTSRLRVVVVAGRASFTAATLPATRHSLYNSARRQPSTVPVFRNMCRKSRFVMMCFVDVGFTGHEAQRAAFGASRISVAVVHAQQCLAAPVAGLLRRREVSSSLL